MRVGDFSVEVIGAGGGTTHELDSGHVVARPGQVYVLRLRNHGPLRCVVEVSLDGQSVTGNGLVINAGNSVDLERPIVTMPTPPGTPSPEPGPMPPRRPMAPPGWTPLTWEAQAAIPRTTLGMARRMGMS